MAQASQPFPGFRIYWARPGIRLKCHYRLNVFKINTPRDFRAAQSVLCWNDRSFVLLANIYQALLCTNTGFQAHSFLLLLTPLHLHTHYYRVMLFWILLFINFHVKFDLEKRLYHYKSSKPPLHTLWTLAGSALGTKPIHLFQNTEWMPDVLPEQSCMPSRSWEDSKLIFEIAPFTCRPLPFYFKVADDPVPFW